MKSSFLIFCISFLTAHSLQAAPKTVFVQLFEWPWNDIATECEVYLGPNGFSAVQVSPPQEHINSLGSPWWERYQPVSYEIISRSGTELQFKEMVARCSRAGVDVYVDAVINHMSGFESGVGLSGRRFEHFNYESLYSFNDFHHCNRNGDDNIVNFNDRYELFNCELLNLADLNTASKKVQTTIADYLNKLTDFGVKGFRIDAAKHMDPADLQAIVGRLKATPYLIQELIVNPGEPISYSEYAATGDMTVFAFPFAVGAAFKQQNLARLFHLNYGLPPSEEAVVFVDNHDLQRLRDRSSLLTFEEDPLLFRLAQVFMLTWPYAYPQVFSGFKMNGFDQGPPLGHDFMTKPVDCTTTWSCEHRLPEVAGLVRFRNLTDRAFYTTNRWSNGKNQMAFSRGHLGFVAINSSTDTIDEFLQTSLPSGYYCNLAEGLSSADHNCAKLYYVDSNSRLVTKIQPKSAVVLLANERIKK